MNSVHYDEGDTASRSLWFGSLIIESLWGSRATLSDTCVVKAMSVVLVPAPLAAANVDRLPEGGDTGLSPAEMVTMINAGTIP